MPVTSPALALLSPLPIYLLISHLQCCWVCSIDYYYASHNHKRKHTKTQTCSPLRNRIKMCFQSEVVHSTSRTSHGHLDSLIVPYLLSSILAQSTVPNPCCEAHSVISLVDFPSTPALPTPPARTGAFSQTPKLLNTCSLLPDTQHLSSLP